MLLRRSLVKRETIIESAPDSTTDSDGGLPQIANIGSRCLNGNSCRCLGLLSRPTCHSINSLRGAARYVYGANHSITSSARARTVGRMVKPSTLAAYKVYDQLELGRRLNQQIAGLFALQDTANVNT